VLKRNLVLRWVRAALRDPDAHERHGAELTIRVVDEVEGLSLNETYRSKAYATNVLTFDYAQEPVLVADLILCAPVIEAEAADQGRTLEAHYAHMVVHGVLHARGFDHEEDLEAEAMESLESELMVALGYDDPFRQAAKSRAQPRAKPKSAARTKR
jgi:probable rRNA maturation factor